MRPRRRTAVATLIWALGFCALLALGATSVYYAYSTRLNGGAANSGFQLTLTTSNSHIAVPKGDVLVVIPPGIDSTATLGFEPSNVKVVLGVNNTILFANEDSTEHIVQSYSWPNGSEGFDVWLLGGQTGTVKLNVTGTYVYNFELTEAANNGTVTVVA